MNWSSGENVEGSYNWRFIGECATPNSEPSVDCSALPAWQASKIYTKGNTVVHNGIKYTARYWTLNQTPDTSFGAWRFIDKCSGSSCA